MALALLRAAAHQVAGAGGAMLRLAVGRQSETLLGGLVGLLLRHVELWLLTVHPGKDRHYRANSPAEKRGFALRPDNNPTRERGNAAAMSSESAFPRFRVGLPCT